MSDRSHQGQHGLVRGCCLGVVLLLAVCAMAAYAVDRVLAAPNLGGPPAGPSHGSSEAAIAVSLGTRLATLLATHPHGAVTLSEMDLTVVASAHNPDPAAYRHLAVRVRDALLVLAADVSVGPIPSTAVARVSVSVDDADAAAPRLHSQLEELDAGQLGLPGWLRDRFASVVSRSTAVSALFHENPALQAAAGNIECAAVVPAGLLIGVHRPGVAPDPAACGA